MTSINPHPDGLDKRAFDWQTAGLAYFSYGFYLRQLFGQRVQKVSIDAGFTCPNVDGSVAIGGCTFCDNRSFSPSRRIPRQRVIDQIDEEIRRIVESSHSRAKDLIISHRIQLDALVEALLEHETLDRAQFLAVMAGEPFPVTPEKPEDSNESTKPVEESEKRDGSVGSETFEPGTASGQA